MRFQGSFLVHSCNKTSNPSHHTLPVIAHDFFTPQPIRDASVFLLRVVLHDWSDTFARKILLQLREAAFLPNSDGTHGTTLIIADHILPLACVDDFEEGGEMVEGASKMLAPPPLLANLGKASVNAYWMDMTVSSRSCSQRISADCSHLDARNVQRPGTNSPRDRCTYPLSRMESHESIARTGVVIRTYNGCACYLAHPDMLLLRPKNARE